ncbi:pilus assembly PilX N-terminal domain-containing protein [Eubacterium maltosivorans]|uniref:pilus assembly PilX N-terminal domain-containing protein n=1 Tax=Eubacterium maltosivorans TaxID=2041044 RepID=UPI00189D7DD6|nr:pilus assembly PilX N-terminal domain-containing protein [Eubacterium maltosivorans]
MKTINNKQGSALVWVLVICLIFGILGVAIGWVALSMNRRSIKNDNLNQSYFTALSVADSVFNGLNGYEDGNKASEDFYHNLYKNLVYGNIVKNENYFIKYDDVLNTSDATNEENVAGMGKCNVEASMSMGKVKITATAIVNDISDTVILDAYRKPESIVWPAKEWASEIDPKDYQNGSIYRQIYVGNNASITNPESKKNIETGAMDVAVYKLAENKELTGKLTVSRDIAQMSDNTNKNLEKRAIFIYLEKDSILTITGMDFAIFNGKTKIGPSNDTTVDKWFETDKGYTYEDWANYYGPDVFIYMEDGAQLIFNNPNRNVLNGQSQKEIVPFALYITGVGNTQKAPTVTTNATNNNDFPIKIYWIQDVVIKPKNGSQEWLCDSDGKAFSKNENNGAPSRMPLSGYKQAGKPYSDSDTKAGEELKDNGGILPNRWEIYQYERKQVQ